MRYVLCLMLALGTAAVASTSATAYAKDADKKDAKTVQDVTKQDPNYRWHNGQWWYWQAGPQRWLVWSGGEWREHQPQRVVRRFSYQPDISTGTQSFRPRSSSGGSINNSFGVRGAGSKLRGNY